MNLRAYEKYLDGKGILGPTPSFELGSYLTIDEAHELVFDETHQLMLPFADTQQQESPTMNDHLVMHSHRPLTKPCAGCGTTGLRWAHDKTKPQNEPCYKCSNTDGRLVLVEQDGALHMCKAVAGPGGSPDVNPDTKEATEELMKLAGKLAGMADGEAKAKLIDGNADLDGGSQDPYESSGETEAPEDDSECHECCEVHREKLNEHNRRINGTRDIFLSHEKLIDGVSKATHEVGVLASKAEATARRAFDEARQARKEGAGGLVVQKIEVIRDDKPVKEIEETAHQVLPTVVKSLATGINILMVGPAGTGKSHISRQAATALDLPYYSIPLSPQTMTSSILGYLQAEGKYVPTLFRKAYEEAAGAADRAVVPESPM